MKTNRPFVSIVAMDEKYYRISPLDPLTRIADTMHYEQIDVESCDINHVILRVAGKAYVVDGVHLSNAVYEMIARGRRR